VQRLLDAHEHGAVASVNEFCQNLYLYGSGPLVERHQECLLTNSAIIERMVLPYLEVKIFSTCVMVCKNDTFLYKYFLQCFGLLAPQFSA